MLPLLVLSVFLVLILYLFILPRTKGNGKAPPLIFTGLPLIGPVIEFLKGPLPMVKNCYEKYGPVFTLVVPGTRITFMVGPEAQEPFFRLGDESLSPQECYGFMKPVFGPGVVYDASKKNRQTQFQVRKIHYFIYHGLFSIQQYNKMHCNSFN